MKSFCLSLFQCVTKCRMGIPYLTFVFPSQFAVFLSINHIVQKIQVGLRIVQYVTHNSKEAKEIIFTIMQPTLFYPLDINFYCVDIRMYKQKSRTTSSTKVCYPLPHSPCYRHGRRQFTETLLFTPKGS